MLRLTFLFLGIATVFVGNTLHGEPTAQGKLDALLRKLEKDIAKVRGLEFKSPVVAKIIPRPAKAAKSIQGYYSIKEKRLFLYDDLSSAYERGVLIHEMVHTLQDQHFGLAKLHQESFGSDAELALAALIEGDATFTMIELLKKDQPRVAAMLDSPLEKAKNLQNAFLYAQGARFVKALKERGGWKAVNAAYRFPPKTTAAILHPEGVSTIDLGPGKTVGELGIIKLFAAQPETKAQAVSAAAGWQGDRFLEKDQEKSWVVAFANKDNARRFQEIMVRFQKARYLESELKQNILVRGERVLVLQAADDAGIRTQLDRLEGMPPMVIHAAASKKSITFGQMMDALSQAGIICLGETHDSDLCHRVQLQIIKTLFACDERLGVGLEMFQKPFQPAVDRYFRGESSEEEFLKTSEYRKRWGYNWFLYRPIVEFCKKNGIPVAALNAPKELTQRISQVGFAQLKDEEKKQLGDLDLKRKDHRDYWLERLAKMHGKSKVSAEQKERSYQVMAVWDDFMAASAAHFQKERNLRRIVILAGSGHIERGFGIPLRTAERTGGKVLTVGIYAGESPEKKAGETLTNFTVVVR
jgi:uncharacterized iron-regulated protein